MTFPRLSRRPSSTSTVSSSVSLHTYTTHITRKSFISAPSPTLTHCLHTSWRLDGNTSCWISRTSRVLPMRLLGSAYSGTSGEKWASWRDEYKIVRYLSFFLHAVLYWLFYGTFTITSLSDLMSRQFVAELEHTPNHTHVLLITTGSVASIKAPLIVHELLRVSILSCSATPRTLHTQYSNVKVEVVSTKQSLAFFDPAEVERAGARVWTDDDEWSVRPAPP